MKKRTIILIVGIAIAILSLQSCMRPQCGDIYKAGFKSPPKLKSK